MRKFICILALLVLVASPSFAQIDTTKSLGTASNKELFGELLRRLAESKKPANWTPGTLMTTARVDSFLKATGWVRGLRDAQGNLRAATIGEFGDATWGVWYGQYWLGYKKLKHQLSVPVVVEQMP